MTKKSCPKCGKEIFDSEAQCVHCGTTLETQEHEKEPTATEEVPTKSVREIYEDFLRNDSGYKIFKKIRTIILIIMLLTFVIPTSLVCCFAPYILVNTNITSQLSETFDLLTILVVAMEILILIFMMPVSSITMVFLTTDFLITFFGVKNHKFNIEKTLKSLNANGAAVVNTTIQVKRITAKKISIETNWIQIFSIYDKSAFMIQCCSVILEYIGRYISIFASMLGLIFTSICLQFIPLDTILNNEILNYLLKLLIIPILVFIIVSIIVSYLISLLRKAFTASLKSRQEAILKAWKMGKLNINYNYETLDNKNSNSKSKLEKFFPLLKFNTSGGKFVLGLLLVFVFNFIGALVIIGAASIISSVLALIPIIGWLIDIIVVTPITLLICFITGTYWFISLILQIVMFVKNKNK